MNLKVLSIRTYGVSTWLWAFMLKLKQKFSKTKSIQKTTTTLNPTTTKEPKITTLHKIIAKIYIHFHIYGMGRHIEIWGEKIQ